MYMYIYLYIYMHPYVYIYEYVYLSIYIYVPLLSLPNIRDRRQSTHVTFARTQGQRAP